MIKKNLIILVLIFFALNIVCSQSTTKTSNGAHAEKIDKLIQSLHENGKFNGSILVSENGKVIYKNALGFEKKSKGDKLKIESAFYLASVSKQFTAMAIMMLKENNDLNYNDKLSKYFPEFPSYADEISIKHLMTHTSGIKDYFKLGLYKPNLNNKDVLDILIKQKELDFNPGDKYNYSNSGYLLLAMIVEKVSNQPFHKYMYDSIFKPLGMNSTLVYDESKPKIDNRAIGHNKRGKLDDYEILTVGDGGIFSNVEDLYIWEKSLYTEKLVSNQTMEEAFKPTVLNNGKLSNYGYGWALNIEKNTAQHGGGLSGFRTFIHRGLKSNNSYIFLTNFGDAVSIGKIKKEIDKILLENN